MNQEDALYSVSLIFNHNKYTVTLNQKLTLDWSKFEYAKHMELKPSVWSHTFLSLPDGKGRVKANVTVWTEG